jgi:hypothetical protein
VRTVSAAAHAHARRKDPRWGHGRCAVRGDVCARAKAMPACSFGMFCRGRCRLLCTVPVLMVRSSRVSALPSGAVARLPGAVAGRSCRLDPGGLVQAGQVRRTGSRSGGRSSQQQQQEQQKHSKLPRPSPLGSSARGFDRQTRRGLDSSHHHYHHPLPTTTPLQTKLHASPPRCPGSPTLVLQGLAFSRLHTLTAALGSLLASMSALLGGTQNNSIGNKRQYSSLTIGHAPHPD